MTYRVISIYVNSAVWKLLETYSGQEYCFPGIMYKRLEYITITNYKTPAHQDTPVRTHGTQHFPSKMRTTPKSAQCYLLTSSARGTVDKIQLGSLYIFHTPYRHINTSIYILNIWLINIPVDGYLHSSLGVISSWGSHPRSSMVDLAAF